MINSFSQYLVEEERVVYFTFGRMNPPTIGHGKLMDALAAKAGRNPYFIYLSQSNNAKKDPIPYKDKIKHVRKMFPKHGRQIVINKKVITPFFALSDLYNKGYRKVVMVAGSDRVQEYDLRLNKYNGKKSQHGFYNFEGGVKIVSAGQRDADAEGASGASGTKQRKHAIDGNFTKFAQGLPKTMSNNDARRLYNDVRKGMGLKEQNEFKRHVQLQPVSETREKFIEGELFDIGEQVIIKKTDEVGTISVLGSNYVIVETADRKTRQWLDAVEKIDEEYKYTEGTPEAAAHARKMTPGQPREGNGLWANMHAKKARGEKMRKKGEKGAPTPDQIARAQETTEERDYKKEYENYQGKPEQIERRSSRNKARRAMTALKGSKAVKGKDIGHKDNNPMNNDPTNLRTEDPSKNRREPRLRNEAAQDPDIKDKEGTQPKKYYAGLAKSTKDKRDAHFKKFGKKSDSSNSSYKPAPGDADAKTKPSKHTLRFKKMFGESEASDRAKARIEREKAADAKRHDRMLDRARLKDTKTKNKETK